MTERMLGELLLPFLGTSLGAGCVFFLEGGMGLSLQRVLTGFAAGVMAAASTWSLLIPAMEQAAGLGRWAFLPAVIGFWLGVLFLLAYLLRNGGMGVALARMFHTYNLYVSSPLPNLSPFNGTGVLGLGLLAALLVWAVRRRDWPDLLVTAALGGLNLLYFSMEWNYQLLRFLNLTGGVL